MHIVPMQDFHISQIAALERACFSDPWTEDAFLYELENPLSLWLAALDGETVAGYIGSQAVLDEADIMNVAVHPSYRRRGIAKALLQELERCLSEKGVEILALEVRASNEPAIRLYNQLGYTLAGIRKNYYFHPKEDALILKKHLHP